VKRSAPIRRRYRATLTRSATDRHRFRESRARSPIEATTSALLPDGQSAITILEGLRTLPSIAITDLEMAGVDGEEVARSLARRYPGCR
jgi:CheY-like chemotaxis protein